MKLLYLNISHDHTLMNIGRSARLLNLQIIGMQSSYSVTVQKRLRREVQRRREGARSGHRYRSWHHEFCGGGDGRQRTEDNRELRRLALHAEVRIALYLKKLTSLQAHEQPHRLLASQKRASD